MVYSTGPVLLLLGLSGAMGQVFIFVTISKFGALTCSIIGKRSLGPCMSRLDTSKHKSSTILLVG